MIEFILPILIFIIAGALDGVRDAIGDSKLKKVAEFKTYRHEKLYPEAFCFLLRLGKRGSYLFRWLMGIEIGFKMPRIKIGKLCNIPLDGWHACKTITYTLFAVGTIIIGTNWIMLIICWGVLRPITQNIVQWSCLYNRWTFHKGLF